MSDTRFNGVGLELNNQQCYATLVKTWVDNPNGTVPNYIVDQPTVAVTVLLLF